MKLRLQKLFRGSNFVQKSGPFDGLLKNGVKESCREQNCPIGKSVKQFGSTIQWIGEQDYLIESVDGLVGYTKPETDTDIDPEGGVMQLFAD